MTYVQATPSPNGVAYDDHDIDGITVTDLDDPANGSVFGSVLGVYEQHGYEAGHRRGVQDVLLLMLSETEELIRRRRLSGDLAGELRRVVWALQDDVQRRTDRPASSDGFVEGGLGI
jgi:hypothetical protein